MRGTPARLVADRCLKHPAEPFEVERLHDVVERSPRQRFAGATTAPSKEKRG